MIRRILVTLDRDLDTEVATRYAIDMARLHGAQVNGLAVVDLESIEASMRGGGIGSFYYARKVEERLTEESRDVARDLMARFSKAMNAANVSYSELMQEGVPFRRIVEDMKYHDLLIMGKDPHFFYAHPTKDTHTVARVVKNTIAASLVVGDEFRPVKRALVTYDGSAASARAIRRFLHLQPFGKELDIDLLHVYFQDQNESELLLRLMKEYFDAHNFVCRTVSIRGTNPSAEIVNHAKKIDADLLVAGAHSVSAIKRIAFGSTTNSLLSECPIPMFVDN
jgi:nucleotide-binding universal stress UspA family protein